jgi:hypothetical protein
MAAMVKSLYRSFAALALAAVVLVPAPAHADKPEKDDKGDKGHGLAVPEISGAHAGIALALVLGGAAIVVGRRRRKSS